jgi:hypothetical protein
LANAISEREARNNRHEHTDGHRAINARGRRAGRQIEIHRICPAAMPIQKAIAQTATIAACAK